MLVIHFRSRGHDRHTRQFGLAATPVFAGEGPATRWSDPIPRSGNFRRVPFGPFVSFGFHNIWETPCLEPLNVQDE